MKKEFRLPDVGEGLTEADIVSWHVKPGDTVTINQIIVDIETAKAVVELPSPYAGTVSALLVEVGQTVDVGVSIIAIDVPTPRTGPSRRHRTARGITRRAGHATGSNGTKDGPPARQPVLVGYGVKPGSTSRRPRKKQAPTRPGLLPGHAVRPADRRAGSARWRAGRESPVPGRDQAAAWHSRSRQSLGQARPGPGKAAGPASRQGPRHRPGRDWREAGRRARSPETMWSRRRAKQELVLLTFMRYRTASRTPRPASARC